MLQAGRSRVLFPMSLDFSIDLIFSVICDPIVYKMWEPGRLTTLWASTACYRDSFIFTIVLVAQLNVHLVVDLRPAALTTTK
jgi:hypothetical protein